MPKDNIIIIGAGPAGLATGIRLAKLGYKPLLFEKQKDVETSPCAEGADSLVHDNFLKDTGFDYSPYVSKSIDGMKIIFHSGKVCYGLGPGIIFDRTPWQKAMADYFVELGGKLNLSQPVTQIDKKNKYIISKGRKYNYDILVNASGPLGIEVKKCDILVACQYRIKASTDGYRYVEMYVDKRYSPHYSWIFPKKDILNVGLSGDFKHLDQFVKDMDIKGDIVKKEAYPIPIGGIDYYDKDIFYIGDVVGMASPLTGGGIDISIIMSRFLAEAIVSGDHLSYEKNARMNLQADIYHEDKKMIEQLSDEALDNISDIVEGKNIFKLGSPTFLKILLSPKIDSRFKYSILHHIKLFQIFFPHLKSSKATDKP